MTETLVGHTAGDGVRTAVDQRTQTASSRGKRTQLKPCLSEYTPQTRLHTLTGVVLFQAFSTPLHFKV